ncbi:uncharacterized protein si:ch211-227n13.3 isoform X2 [Neoarius graeffei]|uniref:uncharacterized protein si:ch211-227n13.3 isoform X2 n=1 Tax=Neoarius graeffei TaxID=443677 RepID=UPI00298C0674|nr:uncharacterized protein si:ch211-227n13.3 isoform X2 [Neoarius graeffei]
MGIVNQRRQKISLPMGSKAEDTLNSLRSNEDASGLGPFSGSPFKSCAESELDGSGSEGSVVSGPSSPPVDLRSLRCRKCDSLFSKMRRQGPPRKKPRNNNPASLSCDEWLLEKTWQPLRRPQSRGRLWVHLKRIRLRAAKQSDDGMMNKAWPLCSRPHVFLQRNLRRCKKISGKPSKSKAKSVHLRRNQANPTRPLRSGKYQRQKKRKSSEKADASEHLSPVDLTNSTEDELSANENAHHEKVPKKQSVSDASGFMDIQVNGSGQEGTQRVLRFDTSSPSAVLAETHTPKHRLVHVNAGGKSREGRADFIMKNRDCPRRLDEDSDAFRTPTELLGAELKPVRKVRPSRPFGARKDSFRTMLAALGHGRNQIIKEFHH